MPSKRNVIDFDSFFEDLGDAVHLLLSPLIALMHLLGGAFRKREYRVSYSYSNGLVRTTDRFKAYHDRAAYREAARIAGSSDFKLEQVRSIRYG